MYVFNYFHLRKYIIQHTYVPQCAAKDTRDMKRQELKLNHPVTVERPFLAVGSSITTITPTQQQYKSVTHTHTHTKRGGGVVVPSTSPLTH